MSEFLPQSVIEDCLLTCSVDGEVAVTSVGCQIVREWQGAMIRQRLDGVVGQHGGRVAVCLAGVTGLSSGFIRDLIQLTDRCTSMGGRMVLYALAPEILSTFKAAGFDAKLRIAATREEAVAGIRGVSAPTRRVGLWERLIGRRAA